MYSKIFTSLILPIVLITSLSGCYSIGAGATGPPSKTEAYTMIGISVGAAIVGTILIVRWTKKLEDWWEAALYESLTMENQSTDLLYNYYDFMFSFLADANTYATTAYAEQLVENNSGRLEVVNRQAISIPELSAGQQFSIPVSVRTPKSTLKKYHVRVTTASGRKVAESIVIP